MTPPHRFAYEMTFGPTEAPAIDHLCRVTLCVNPLHLEAVTDQINILRGVSAIAKNAAKTHCPEGHPYDGQFKDGRRYCKGCRKTKQHQNYLDRKAQAVE